MQCHRQGATTIIPTHSCVRCQERGERGRKGIAIRCINITGLATSRIRLPSWMRTNALIYYGSVKYTPNGPPPCGRHNAREAKHARFFFLFLQRHIGTVAFSQLDDARDPLLIQDKMHFCSNDRRWKILCLNSRIHRCNHFEIQNQNFFLSHTCS